MLRYVVLESFYLGWWAFDPQLAAAVHERIPLTRACGGVFYFGGLQ